MNIFRLKLIISIGAGVLILIHLVVPSLNIDAITLGLFIVLILPWLSSLIKSAELPGGWKIEFQDIQSAGAKVTKENPITKDATEAPTPAYLEVASRDPNLALAGLRIEIEKRLRALAKINQLRDDRPLGQLFNDLRRLEVLNDPSVSGLQELIMAGNQAAHGAKVDDEIATWAFDFGPQVLAVLDAKLNPAA